MVKTMREREERQQKRNRVILGIIITIIMVGSTIGYFVGDSSNNSGGLEYKAKDGKKYTFEQMNGKLYTKINDKTVSFYTHPLDALELNVSSDAEYLIKNSQMFYITFDPDSKDIQYIEQARFELLSDMIPLQKYAISGVIKNSTIYSNYEIITCKNASYYVPVMDFVYANNTETRVYAIDSCIIFQGKRDDFLRFRDYVLYKSYNVI